jgi:hypothetical protein
MEHSFWNTWIPWNEFYSFQSQLHVMIQLQFNQTQNESFECTEELLIGLYK